MAKIRHQLLLSFMFWVPDAKCRSLPQSTPPTKPKQVSPQELYSPNLCSFSHLLTLPPWFRVCIASLDCGNSLRTASSPIYPPHSYRLTALTIALSTQKPVTPTTYKCTNLSAWHLKPFTMNPNLPCLSCIKKLPQLQPPNATDRP